MSRSPTSWTWGAVLAMHADDEPLLSALPAGARDYLVKGADKAELIQSILAMAETVAQPMESRSAGGSGECSVGGRAARR